MSVDSQQPLHTHRYKHAHTCITQNSHITMYYTACWTGRWAHKSTRTRPHHTFAMVSDNATTADTALALCSLPSMLYDCRQDENWFLAKEIQADPPKAKYTSLTRSQMLSLMDEYGPEAHCPRRRPKKNITDYSLRRRFQRWFPHFFFRFRFDEAEQKYVPILGHEMEKTRRAFVRRRRQMQKKYQKKKPII